MPGSIIGHLRGQMLELGSLRGRENSVHSNEHQYARDVTLPIDCKEPIDDWPRLFVIEHTGRQHLLNPSLLRGDLTTEVASPGQRLTIDRVELFDLLRRQLDRVSNSRRSPPRLAISRLQVG